MVDKEIVFSEWYEAEKDRIFRLCLGFSGNQEDAKDLFQEVIIKIWKNLDGFEQRSSRQTWIYRITTNTALQWIEKRKRNKNVKSIAHNILYQESEKSAPPDKLVKLRRAISRLPETDRILITLLLEGCTYKEISEVTGMKVNHVGVRLNRIRNRIKKDL